MKPETAIAKTRKLHELRIEEQRILIEEASEYRTLSSRGHPKHLLDRFDDNPQTIHDEAVIV